MTDKWQAEQDLRTLREAEVIRGDKTRLTKAKGILAEELEALSALSNKDFRDLKARLVGNERDEV